ncbi:MAG: sugar phosphate isomerase/epimerase [Chloroflexi bacterium]|nr:sugar phosphate isomerase/epimerase [Chloroflexota bacterium]
MQILQSGNPGEPSWQDQYAISTFTFRNAGLLEALRKIAASGFKWIEISSSEFHLDPRRNPDVPAARNALRQMDLHVHALHTPFIGLKLGHPNRALKQEWLRVVGASLEIGVEIGAPLAVIHVTDDAQELTDEMYEASRQIVIEYIAELQIRAQALGIRLALENMVKSPNLRRRFGMTLAELSRAFPDPEIAFCLDTGHAMTNRLDLATEIRAAGKRLMTTHINSNDGVDDLHWLPTRGVLDWQKIKHLLMQSGYAGRYLLEVKGDADPDAILTQAVAFARADRENNT